jgi:hypothetical protein
MMVLQLIWVRTMVPETKGVPLEELEQRLTGAGSRDATTAMTSVSRTASGG